MTGAVDLAATAYYGGKGDYGNTFVSDLSVVPFGDIAKLSRVSKHVETIGKAISAGGDNAVKVRHFTRNQGLKSIEADNFINPGGRAAPYGVDVEVAPFGSPKSAQKDLGAQGGSYVEFDAQRSELINILGGGGAMGHNGRNTARIPTGNTPRDAMANPVNLSGRNPTFNKKSWF